MRGTARFFHILFLILLLAFSTIPAQSAVAPGSQAALQVPNLEGTEDLDDDWVVLPHRETGSTRFLSTRSGNPIMQPRMLAPMATTETAARTFLDSYGYLFGLRNQADELAVMSERITTDGRSLVRFQQQHMGVPILAGEMIVNMDSVGNVRSISAEVLPDLDVETAPGISPESASQIALEFVSSEYQIESGNLQVSEPVLWIYNPALLGAPGLRMDSLVWRVEVNALNFLPVRELVLVDAHSGQISLHFNQSHETIARAVYDVNNDGTQSVSVDTLAINEGDPETGIIDVDNAYDYAGFTYDFYASRHGRDSLDDHGMPMVSVVRFCVTAGTCPLSNAWWSGTHVVFGDGFSSADDVVAHEFTHGVTEFESNLFYYMESGAINEAFSDIWGEFIDLNYSNGRDNDSPEVRWLIGEDIPGLGAIRSMSHPPEFNQPDRMSEGYSCSLYDSGSVHANSGVANKAAYLMADGDTFNNIEVIGIGIDKTAKIWYEVQTNLLTSGADYADLGSALGQACQNLIGVDGITPGDCENVDKAVQAVEMFRSPGCAQADVVPLCEIEQFDSDFSSAGWSAYNGIWDIDLDGAYSADGIAEQWVSAGMDKAYADFDYQVRLQRDGDPASPHGIFLRGAPGPLDQNMMWNSGYLFLVKNNGEFSVWRRDSGISANLAPWTYTSALFTEGSPNDLRVVAEGSRLDFYINGEQVWTGSDPTHTRGQVGFAMYGDSSGLDHLKIISARLSGGAPLNIFYDNLENPVSGNWITSGNSWYYPQSANPFGSFRGDYPASGAYNLWARAPGDVSDHSIAMAQPIWLPTDQNAFLHFNHAYEFDLLDPTGLASDGGVVEYSADGGPWIDAADLFTHHGYNTMIADSHENPLSGRQAFSSASYGYRSSRLDLSSLAGRDVRFRFRVGTDVNGGNRGWFIDDVRLYTCQDQIYQLNLPLVMAPGDQAASPIHSSFNGDFQGWTSHYGGWDSNPSYLTTQGDASYPVSLGHEDNFDDLDLSVRVKRAGCSSCANTIIVRGDPGTLTDSKNWNSGYAFQFSRDGHFSVLRYLEGIATTLQPWTPTEAVNNVVGADWNLLRAVVEGSELSFYINGELVWSGSDAALSSGKVGLAMTSSESSILTDLLMVDWVSVVPLE